MICNEEGLIHAVDLDIVSFPHLGNGSCRAHLSCMINEGMPRWPSKYKGEKYSFMLFAEDFKAWIALLGYADYLKDDALTNMRLSEQGDALVLRYIVAAITNPP